MLVHLKGFKRKSLGGDNPVFRENGLSSGYYLQLKQEPVCMGNSTAALLGMRKAGAATRRAGRSIARMRHGGVVEGKKDKEGARGLEL